MKSVWKIFLFFVLSLWFSFSASAQKEEINIGFLIPDHNTLAARDGAALAVEEANEKGGYAGRHFNLVVRSVEGLWGTGSKQAVSMIFDYEVVAIAASLDGRNAHLAEQITTKTKVAFVSTRSTDMTLSYAFVPWYFRCIPDDKQQASALIEEVCRKRNLSDILLVGEDSYDAENAMATFVKMAQEENLSPPHTLTIKNSMWTGGSPEPIDLPRAQAYILFGTPALAKTFMDAYHQKELQTPLFGTISLLDDGKSHTPDQKNLERVVIISPELWFTEKGKRFTEHFRERYGYEPGPAAAYAYDGVGCIIEAVRRAGTNRNRVIGYLSGIRYTGATGFIRFDERGNREGPVRFLLMKKGIPTLYRIVQ